MESNFATSAFAGAPGFPAVYGADPAQVVPLEPGQPTNFDIEFVQIQGGSDTAPDAGGIVDDPP